MTTRGEINSNFYQIVNVDANGTPTSVKTQYITSGNVDNATHANVSDSANSVAGANVTGQVHYAQVANSVSVANVSGIGNIATVNLNGNVNTVLAGNGAWVEQLSPNAANANYANFAGTSFNVSGSNVTGEVAYAAVANSVSVANVSGIGNISTINKDGSSSHVLYGNGAWADIPTVSNVANANYSNFAGTAFNVSGANVSGAVNLANYASVANSVSGSNVSGQVAYAATANSVAGANVSGTVANATYATTSGSATTAVTVTASSQPNITTVGTLTSLEVTGNILSYANITGGYIFGDGSYLTGIGNLSAAQGYWGSFYSNVTQTIASTTTAYPVTLNNTDPNSHGVYVSSNSHINFQFAGTYNIQYSFQFTNTSTSVVNTNVWLRKNGVDVADTNSQYAITASHGGTNGQFIGAINYILKLAATDYVQLMWQAEDTSVYMEYISPGTTPTTPAAPSAIITAQQVTNVQPVELQGAMSGNITGNGFSLINIASISSLDGITANTFTGNGAPLTNLTGANVTGYVANATHANISDSANSVAVANVTGIGNIATTNYDGSSSHVLYGNGTWSNISVSNVANANYANYAGNTIGNSYNSPNLVQATISDDNWTFGFYSDLASEFFTQTKFYGTGDANRGFRVYDAGSSTIPFKVDGTGTTTVNNLQANTITSSGNVAAEEVLFIGSGANSTSFTNPTMIAKNAGNTYIQAALINSNVNGSSDWVAYGDNSSDINAWADMGFTSSAFSDPLYTITGPNDGYFFVQGDGNITNGGNLVIATGSQGTTKDIIFATGGFLTSNEKMRYINALNQFYIKPLTNSTSANTGALVVEGGAGIGGNLHVGDDFHVLGTANLGSVSNIHISGGSNSQVLTTDGAGNLSWQTVTSGGTPGGTNTDVQFNDGGSFGGSANLTFDKTTNTLSATNIVGNGSGLTSITGANVTGQVPYAAVANSVSVANVSGIGNIATVNLNGNNSQYLTGAGLFSQILFSANANSVQSNTSTATTAYAMFVSNSANGYFSTVKSTGITANLTANTITASGFTGAVLTPVQANIQQLTNTNLLVHNRSATGGLSTPRYLMLTGTQDTADNLETQANLKFTVSSGLLEAGVFSGQGNALTQLNASNLSTGTVASARLTGSYTGITSVGTLTSVNSSGNITGPNVIANTGAFYGNGAGLTNLNGSNVTGAVAYATTANSVAVANVVGIGNIATLSLDGSSSNVLYGNGIFAPASGGGTPAGSNTQVQFNNGGAFGASANLTFNNTTNTLSATNLVGNGSGLSSITGANVTGAVAYATTANSVAGSNVSGAVGLATYATTANSVAGANVSGQVSYAAVANSVAGANVSGAVGLATYATTANSVAGANVSGQVSYAAIANSVAVANVVGIGNIATINLTGSTSNVLYGNGAFASIGTVANANFSAYAGNVTVAAQANITSLGTLSSLTVSGLTNLGPVGNINISGGSSGYVLSTNGSGTLSWVAQSGGSSATDFTPSFLLGGM